MNKPVENKSKVENRSILKAIGVFGSMRFFQMISSILVAKFVAIFIGPSGVGLLGLLKNAINLIVSFTSFGFSITSVKEIATPLNEKDDRFLLKAISISKRTSTYIGLLGFIVSILLSGVLSQWIFNDYTKFYWFLLLSINFLILSRNTFYITLMKGMRLTKVIAISGVLSSLVGGITTLPIYYFFREKGIIPAIITSNLLGLLVNIYLTRKVNKTGFKGNFKDYISAAKPMLSLGVYLSINVIFGHLCHFFIKLFFNNYVEDQDILGFYEVGMVIIATYAGTVFSVMSIDFYPRLASFQHDNSIVKDLVNKQIVIGILIVTPLILLFCLFDKWLILLLYSKEFLIVSSILKLGLFSTIVKAVIWPLSFIILAKGNKSQYLKQELLGDFLNVSFTILFYLKFGLEGIGLALCFNFIFYGIYLYIYVYKTYNFRFTYGTKLVVISCFVMGGFVIASQLFISTILFNKAIVSIVFLASLAYSLKELNKRMDLIAYVNKKISRN